MQKEDILAITKALSDGSRLRVFMTLRRHEELCVCQIIELLGLAPATVSRHMAVLKAAQLVDSCKQGKWVYFRLSEKIPPGLLDWLVRSLNDSQQLRSDHGKLERILESDPHALCEARKARHEVKYEG